MKHRLTPLFLIGEHRLVKELGHCIDQKLFSIAYRVTDHVNGERLPRSWKKSTRPSSSASIAFELSNTSIKAKQNNLRLLERSLSKNSLICSSSATITVTEQATWLKYPSRLVGISAFPTLLAKPLLEIAPSIHTERTVIEQAKTLLHKFGKESAIVQDRIGMVMPRILCQLINEAFFAVMEDIAAPKDIDTAMKLGTNYPMGPIEWAEQIGVVQVYSVLNALHKDLGEERYRISPLLRQLALSRQ